MFDFSDLFPHSLWGSTSVKKLKLQPDFKKVEEMFKDTSVKDDNTEVSEELKCIVPNQCFQSSAFLRISAVSSFPHSNQRERNAEKKCLQNNLNRASERNAETFLTIPNRASSPRTSEL